MVHLEVGIGRGGNGRGKSEGMFGQVPPTVKRLTFGLVALSTRVIYQFSYHLEVVSSLRRRREEINLDELSYTAVPSWKRREDRNQMAFSNNFQVTNAEKIPIWRNFRIHSFQFKDTEKISIERSYRVVSILKMQRRDLLDGVFK